MSSTGAAATIRLLARRVTTSFVFTTALNASTNVDHITDFSVADDTILVDNAIFVALGGNGTLSAAQFVANASGTASNASQHIIYETDTGWLTYDSNGNAAGGSTHFATLAANLALTNADFVVIEHGLCAIPATHNPAERWPFQRPDSRSNAPIHQTVDAAVAARCFDAGDSSPRQQRKATSHAHRTHRTGVHRQFDGNRRSGWPRDHGAGRWPLRGHLVFPMIPATAPALASGPVSTMPTVQRPAAISSSIRRPTSNQYSPAITALADGRFVATWESSDPGDGDGRCIRAHIFNADGSAAGSDFVVNSTATSSQITAAITALADGRFVASWQSYDAGDGSNSCIRARVYNADGSAAGGDFIVNSTATGEQYTPAITGLADGRFRGHLGVR